MREAYDVGTVRALEAALMQQLPDGALMERAAAGLAATVVDVVGGAYGTRVVLLVGTGDNGGDALLAGARLASRGAQVTAIAVGERMHPHADLLRRKGGRCVGADDGGALRALAGADAVIDGIVGIGGRGELRGTAATLVSAIPDTVPVIAVDVPSGVDADTGEVAGLAVRATVTVCMGVLKPGLLVDPGASHAGVVRVIPIGLAPDRDTASVRVLEDDDVAGLWPRRTATADKYAGGVVGVVAGSAQYPGAALLVAAGATAAGCGYVRFVGDAALVEQVRAARPSVVATVREAEGWAAALAAAGRVQAWVVGPGLGTDDEAADALAAVLARPEPVVVDADAVTLVAQHSTLLDAVRSRSAPTVLTPHAGEAARLLRLDRADVEARRLHSVTAVTEAVDAVVLLKGRTTLVAERQRAAYANPTGTPALAAAGTGDVLSGVIGALLAAGLPVARAAAVGAYVHGVAGSRVAHHGSPGAEAVAREVALHGEHLSAMRG